MLNPATPDFAQSLATLLNDEVAPAPAAYLSEPRRLSHGNGGFLVRPRSTKQVAQVVSACAKACVGIIPYSGGTGLVGGQIYPDGPLPIILSLERMNTCRAADPAGNTLTVEAGMILADVQAAAKNINRLFPLSLASEGSCRIGGNLSTNAGGVQVLRYGNARDLCLGIEAVLPNGDIFNGLKTLRKDNTGYDLRNLLIGAEGTLGIITAATLKLFPNPAHTITAFAVVPSPTDAVTLLNKMQAATDGLLSGFELIDGTGFEFLSETLPDQRRPFDPAPKWMVLLEAGGNASLDETMTQALADALETGTISDVLIAQNQAQRDTFWIVRETIPEANKRIGAIVSHDISIPIDRIPDFITKASAALHKLGPIRINCFGHLGDGNLHFNVYPPKGEPVENWRHLKDQAQRITHDLTDAFDGSISAEHGIGRFKAADLLRYADPAKLATMRSIKHALDPNGILNPGAVLA